MTTTVHHDGIAPEEPALRTGPVVVGIGDRVRDSDQSLRAAAEWAARRHLDVKLVMGLDPVDPFDYDAETADQRRCRTMAEVDLAAHQFALYVDLTQRVHAEISDLPAVEALLAEAETAGLIVLQRRELRPFARLRAGSTSSAVAARAHCPVLVVHADDAVHCTSEKRGVVVGVDERGHAGRAIAEAFKEASWRGVPLTAASAWAPPIYGYAPPLDFEIRETANLAAITLAEQLAGYRDRYPDVELHQVLHCGDPVPMLIDLARQHELVVVARHSDHQRGRRNLGSVTRRVIEEAPCPVLITTTDRPVQA